MQFLQHMSYLKMWQIVIDIFFIIIEPGFDHSFIIVISHVFPSGTRVSVTRFLKMCCTGAWYINYPPSKQPSLQDNVKNIYLLTPFYRIVM